MLIPGVDIKMRFTLNDPKFFMNRLAAVATNVRLQACDLKMKFYACIVRSEIRTYTFKTITLTLKLQMCSMEASQTVWW